ncbi:protein SDA1 homolog [Centruroides sculpturatus]|uniref:protein SDA1 homolog n=1 Tax=Centruroides sculpturatus TaxID=218467 RepID=UPI000C6CFFAC|nr:protein SDA1 homolog [Centruroides sculpturatus]
MKQRQNNRLPNNILQLQNLVKRDPTSYKDEFLRQYKYFQSSLEVFQLKPADYNKDLEDQVMFLAHICHCYPVDLSDYPQKLIEILRKYSMVLNPEMRLIFCRALVLIRNKNLLAPTDLLELFFELLKCQSKLLRKYLKNHIIQDIKNLNAKHRNMKLNITLQNFMYAMLKDKNNVAVKMSLDIMIELYRKNIWNDAKTVNVIATACFSKVTKILVTALKFFLGSDEKDDNDDDDSNSEEEINVRDVVTSNKVNKKTRKRKKLLEHTKKLIKKHKNSKKPPTFNFSAVHLINDPQGMAEKLYKNLECMMEKYEVKLMVINMISRLIGTHQLFLFNFYPFLQKFLQPHQRDVTKILVYTAQSAHELIPPDIIEPILKTIANNFVTERNCSEVMAVGLNGIREICIRCPLAMNEDLLQDLAQYKSYKNKSVMMAARSLIQLFRTINPRLLGRKDRGKPTEASKDLKPKEYGELVAKDYLDGAETLNIEEEEEENDDNDGEKVVDSGSEDSEGWVDVHHSSDENEEDNSVDIEENNQEETIQKAACISQSRILSQEEFQKLKAVQIAKHLQPSKSKNKGVKRKSDFKFDESKPTELVKLDNIEKIYKRRKHDKESRLATVLAGREGREKFTKKKKKSPSCSKTQKEVKKNKAFMMIKYKAKQKSKRSFREKQMALRKALLKRQKLK